MPERSYTYYDFTLSICHHVFEEWMQKLFLNRQCLYAEELREHGFEKVLIATDVEYYKNIRNYNKPGEMPLQFNTKTHFGCPYDCGLCQDHEQHSCLNRS